MKLLNSSSMKNSRCWDDMKLEGITHNKEPLTIRRYGILSQNLR